MRRLAWIIPGVVVVVSSAARGQVNGYEWLANWDDLPKSQAGVSTGLASSYDRSGVSGNKDYNHYEDPEGFQSETAAVTVTTLEGPGMLTRLEAFVDLLERKRRRRVDDQQQLVV